MRSITVAAATSEVLTSEGSNSDKPDSLNIPLTIVALPGAAGTLLVEYQVVENGSWTDWPAGAVASKTIYLLNGPVYALRFTAAADDGVVEITQ